MTIWSRIPVAPTPIWLEKSKVSLTNTKRHTDGAFLIAVDRSTEGTDAAGTTAAVGYIGSDQVQGILFGESFEDSNYIKTTSDIPQEEKTPIANAISPQKITVLFLQLRTYCIENMLDQLDFLKLQ